MAVVSGSFIAAALVAQGKRDGERSRQQAAAHRVATELDAIYALSIAQLKATVALIEIHSHIDGAQFERLTEALVSAQPMRAMTYLEATRVDGAERTRRALSDGRLSFIPKLTSSDSPEGRLRPADEESANELIATFRRVRQSGLLGVTGAVQLEGGVGGQRLVIVHPVRADGPDAAGRRPGATGFVAGAIDVSDLLNSAAASVPVEASLALVGPDGEALYADDPPSQDYALAPVVIADRRWELRLSTPRSAISTLPLLLGAAGLALAAIISFMLLTWSRRERSALELARTRLEQRDQAMRLEAETNRMYRVLAENLTDIVMVADPDSRITYVSPAAQRMLGWLPEEMVGRYVMEFLHEQDRQDSDARFLELRKGAGILTFEHRLRRKDGQYIWVESAVRSIFDSDGERIVEYQSTTRDISERKPLQEQLERLAREDPLTGLVNRRRFGEAMEAEVARAARSGAESCLLLIDIDYFKRVNDTMGHQVGDRALRRVAEVMRSRVRVSDTLARMGGDEFAAILPDTGAEEGETVAAAVMAGVREAFADEPELPAITVSVGVAAFGGGLDLNPEQIIERADLALYSAKSKGRDCLSVYGGSAAEAELLAKREDAGG